jgi:hypothetical protein
MAPEPVRDRTEWKYVLTPEAAEQVMEASKGRFLRRQDGWVTTVYFDRPDLELTRRALQSPLKNQKIRLREYFTPDDEPLSPFVWIEIKERERLSSRKRRFQLHKRLVPGFLSGDLDFSVILTCQSGSPAPALEAFRAVRELAEGPLIPLGAVRYRRRSLEGGVPEARLTLDRQISFYRGPIDLYVGARALDAGSVGKPLWGEPVAVVEVKTREAEPPTWCAAALRGVLPEAYSKFGVLAQLRAAEAEALRSMKQTVCFMELGRSF